MITKLLNETNENIKKLNTLLCDEKYFKDLEERIATVNKKQEEQDKILRERDKEIEKLKLHIIKIKEAISTWNIENDEGHNDFKIPNEIIDIVWSDN